MQFCVFALSSVPDTATTRDLFDLHDLDDKSVSKVLFHRRKQQTGSNESLRWDQRTIASLTLIKHTAEGVRFEAFNLAEHGEQAMLQAYYEAAAGHQRMVSWDGVRADLPLIHFRSLLHGVSDVRYWQARAASGDLHLALCDWLSPGDDDRPQLDETSRKLGFPGMMGLGEGEVFDAWLAGRHADVQAFSDVSALNTYLLALRLLATTGEMGRLDSRRVVAGLQAALDGRGNRAAADFLAAWRND